MNLEILTGDEMKPSHFHSFVLFIAISKCKNHALGANSQYEQIS